MASRRFGPLWFHARESVFDLWLKNIVVISCGSAALGKSVSYTGIDQERG